MTKSSALWAGIAVAKEGSGSRVVCPICGPCGTTFVGVCSRLPVVKCCGCGLMYVAECREPTETFRIFEEAEIPEAQKEDQTFLETRRQNLARGAARIRSHRPTGGRLLDVGTADGFLLHQFQGDPAWEVCGVEPSREAVLYARQTFGVNVHRGFLSDQKFPDGSFDVVCSMDAFLCHTNPLEDMREFFRILSPGGVLAIEIPGHRFRMLVGSGNLYRWLTGRSLRLNAGVNFFYYTRETLSRLAGKCGFELVCSYPEDMPRSSSFPGQLFRSVWDWGAGALYRLTGGHLNFCAKELCIFRRLECATASRQVESRAVPAQAFAA